MTPCEEQAPQRDRWLRTDTRAMRVWVSAAKASQRPGSSRVASRAEAILDARADCLGGIDQDAQVTQPGAGRADDELDEIAAPTDARAGDPRCIALTLTPPLARNPICLPVSERESSADRRAARHRQSDGTVRHDPHHVAAGEAVAGDLNRHLAALDLDGSQRRRRRGRLPVRVGRLGSSHGSRNCTVSCYRNSREVLSSNRARVPRQLDRDGPAGRAGRRTTARPDVRDRHRADLVRALRQLPSPGTRDVLQPLVVRRRASARDKIVAVTAARTMPPWHAAQPDGFVPIRDARRLSDRQIATLRAWADAGAPAGDLRRWQCRRRCRTAGARRAGPRADAAAGRAGPRRRLAVHPHTQALDRLADRPVDHGDRLSANDVRPTRGLLHPTL